MFLDANARMRLFYLLCKDVQEDQWRADRVSAFPEVLSVADRGSELLKARRVEVNQGLDLD